MTQEDLDQIREVVSSALSANNPVLLSAIHAIQAHIDARIAGLLDDVNRKSIAARKKLNGELTAI